MSGKNVKRENGKGSLASRVIALIETARQRVATVANVAQVYTNYEIGRQIVEEEQGGKRRADYGKQIIKDLSLRLTQRFGRGWSEPTLWRIRQFFLLYSDSLNTVEGILVGQDSRNTVERIPQTRFGNSVNTVCEIPKFTLGWAHYLLLIRIADPVERAFYEREATEQYTSVMPSKLALKRIVIEEKRKFEKEKLLALAAAKRTPIRGRKGALP